MGDLERGGNHCRRQHRAMCMILWCGGGGQEMVAGWMQTLIRRVGLILEERNAEKG